MESICIQVSQFTWSQYLCVLYVKNYSSLFCLLWFEKLKTSCIFWQVESQEKIKQFCNKVLTEECSHYKYLGICSRHISRNQNIILYNNNRSNKFILTSIPGQLKQVNKNHIFLMSPK